MAITSRFPVGIRQSVMKLRVIANFCFNLFFSNGMAVAHVVHYAANPSCDSLPISSTGWAEINLLYRSNINGKQYINTAQLLRPIKWLKRHHMGTAGHYVAFSMPEFGIAHVSAFISAIKPSLFCPDAFGQLKTSRRPVIGRFTRYVNNVSLYTFKDSFGHVSHIMSTPNHPFYVKNKQAFSAIEDVTARDQLVGMNRGHVDLVKLVCASGQYSHCGVVPSGYAKQYPTQVYNLEIYRRHAYLVGRDKLLVHNGCPVNKLLYEANSIGDKVHHPIEFKADDLFVRIRHSPDTDGPLKYHASLHVFGQYSYADSTMSMRTIEIRAAEDVIYRSGDSIKNPPP